MSNSAAFNLQYEPNWQTKFVSGITKMLDKIGQDMVEEAQAIVPIGLTGGLQESISYHIENRGEGGRFGFPSLWFGATAEYAAHVEYGHHTVNGGFVEAQPFIRPVLYKDRGQPE